MANEAEITVTNTGTEFEASSDGLSLGFLKYTRNDDHIDAYSTQVDPAARGRGVGGVLVEALVAYATEEGLKIKPTCGYVDGWLTKHPEQDAALRYA